MKKFLYSFMYAWHGVRHCLANEQNFKIHLASSAAVILLAALLRCTGMEWVVLVLCMGVVISLEMINTAVERFCDMQQTAFHPQVKIIKDVAAGAVLVSAIAAAICGGIIFIPKIISFFYSNF